MRGWSAPGPSVKAPGLRKAQATTSYFLLDGWRRLEPGQPARPLVLNLLAPIDGSHCLSVYRCLCSGAGLRQQQQDSQPSAPGADGASQHHQAKAGQKRAIEQSSRLDSLPRRKPGRDGYIVQPSLVAQELRPHLNRQARMGQLGGKTGYKSVSQHQGEQRDRHQPGEAGKCVVYRGGDAGLTLCEPKT